MDDTTQLESSNISQSSRWSSRETLSCATYAEHPSDGNQSPSRTSISGLSEVSTLRNDTINLRSGSEPNFNEPLEDSWYPSTPPPDYGQLKFPSRGAVSLDLDDDASVTSESTIRNGSGLLQLPEGILLRIVSFLATDRYQGLKDRACLSLSCRAFFKFITPGPLRRLQSSSLLIYLYHTSPSIVREPFMPQEPSMSNDQLPDDNFLERFMKHPRTSLYRSFERQIRLRHNILLERAFPSNFYCASCNQWHQVAAVVRGLYSATNNTCLPAVGSLDFGPQYSFSYNAVRLATMRHFWGAPYGIPLEMFGWHGPDASAYRDRCLRTRTWYAMYLQDNEPDRMTVESKIAVDCTKKSHFILKASIHMNISPYTDATSNSPHDLDSYDIMEDIVKTLPPIIAGHISTESRRDPDIDTSSPNPNVRQVYNGSMAHKLLQAYQCSRSILPTSDDTAIGQTSWHCSYCNADFTIHLKIEKPHEQGAFSLKIVTYRDFGATDSPYVHEPVLSSATPGQNHKHWMVKGAGCASTSVRAGPIRDLYESMPSQPDTIIRRPPHKMRSFDRPPYLGSNPYHTSLGVTTHTSSATSRSNWRTRPLSEVLSRAAAISAFVDSLNYPGKGQVAAPEQGSQEPWPSQQNTNWEDRTWATNEQSWERVQDLGRRRKEYLAERAERRTRWAEVHGNDQTSTSRFGEPTRNVGRWIEKFRWSRH